MIITQKDAIDFIKVLNLNKDRYPSIFNQSFDSKKAYQKALEIKRKANKMGAHLTETGVITEDRNWPVIRIRDELNKEIEEFLEDMNTKITEDKKKGIKAIMKPLQIQVPMGSIGATGPAEPFKN